MTNAEKLAMYTDTVATICGWPGGGLLYDACVALCDTHMRGWLLARDIQVVRSGRDWLVGRGWTFGGPSAVYDGSGWTFQVSDWLGYGSEFGAACAAVKAAKEART